MNAETDIVVGIDGSDASLGAAKWSVSVAERLGATVHLVHAALHPTRLPGFDLSVSQQLTDALAADGAAVLSDAVARLRTWAPDSRLTTVLDNEPAAAALLRAARHAAMIVVAATGRGSVERWLLGSTARRVAGEALCPVVVWRGDPTDPGPDSRALVLGIDGSAMSEVATGTAFRWAELLDVPLVAVRAWTDEFAVGSATPEMFRITGPTAMLIDWDAVARVEAERLADSLAPFRDQFPGVAVREVSVRGSASRELLRALDDAQLAVVGSRGRGRLGSALLGSTSQNLLHRADRPVIICRVVGDPPRG